MHTYFGGKKSFFTTEPPLAPKTKRRTARHSSPRTPPAVPSDSTFLRLRRNQPDGGETAERSDSAFHSRKNYSGFSAKKVRTSVKNVSNFVESAKSPEIASSQTTSGGRGGIPP